VFSALEVLTTMRYINLHLTFSEWEISVMRCVSVCREMSVAVCWDSAATVSSTQLHCSRVLSLHSRFSYAALTITFESMLSFGLLSLHCGIHRCIGLPTLLSLEYRIQCFLLAKSAKFSTVPCEIKSFITARLVSKVHVAATRKCYAKLEA